MILLRNFASRKVRKKNHPLTLSKPKKVISQMTSKDKLVELEKRIINIEMKLQFLLGKQKTISIKRGKKKRVEGSGRIPF